MPEIQPYNGTHMRKVKTYSILSKVFLPIGIVLLALFLLLLPIGIFNIIQGIAEMEKSGNCVVTETSIRCSDLSEAAAFVIGVLCIVFSSLSLTFGLPLFILSFVFRGRARANRALDEKNGIDYSDFPYGK